MSTFIRIVHNTTTLDQTTSHTNVVIPASSTVDLFTVLTGYELLQVQSDLVEMVAAGTLTIVQSDPMTEVLAGGALPQSLTSTQITAFTTATPGTVVYNSTTGKLNFWSAFTSSWQVITSA